ncbi:MAG: peptidoglycan editing factor PgeF [Varibaculum sp.]|nr:peptidoglycan editing factor PgeF [Varibaculum sp.]
MFNLGRARAVFTNRTGGVSSEPYNTLNLSVDVGDDERAVAANRARVNRAVGADVLWLHQVHSHRVLRLRPGYTANLPDADGVILDSSEFRSLGLRVPGLGVQVADCVPVLFGSDDGQIIGVVHAGRAGVATGIVKEAAYQFRVMGVPANRIYAAVGPCICGQCYEVPYDLQQHVARLEPATWSLTRESTPALDLRSGVVQQLRTAGFKITFVSRRCTYEEPRLFSYRRDGVTGRFSGVVVSHDPDLPERPEQP